MNNLKQLGIAMTAYEVQWEMFPPATCITDTANVTQNQATSEFDNWVIENPAVLRQHALVREIRPHRAHLVQLDDKQQRDGGHDEQRLVAVGRAPIYVVSNRFLQSAAVQRLEGTGQDAATSASFGDNWARGNYAANSGLAMFTAANGTTCFNGGPLTDGWIVPQMRGICGVNCACTARISDGLQNTILVGETRRAYRI